MNQDISVFQDLSIQITCSITGITTDKNSKPGIPEFYCQIS